jgi:hypothetical protein
MVWVREAPACRNSRDLRGFEHHPRRSLVVRGVARSASRTRGNSRDITSNGRKGATCDGPAAQAERPLSDRSGDLRQRVRPVTSVKVV